jgi:diguanylate cyclase (GGDEF)-like protein
MRASNLRIKLILVLGSVLCVAFVFSSVLNYIVSRHFLRESALTETLPLLSDTIFSEMQHHLMRPIHNSSLMAQDEFLKNWVRSGERDVDLLTQYLDTIKNEYNYFTAFFVSDNTKNYYYYKGILKTISDDDEHDVWYALFRDLNRPFDLDVDHDEASQGALTIFINHRLEDDDGALLGVTGIGLKMDNLDDIFERYHTQYGRLVYMVDSAGLVQMHPDINLVENANLRDFEGMDAVADRILAKVEEQGVFDITKDGAHTFVSTRYFPDFDWFLVVEQAEEMTLVPVRNTLVANLLVGLSTTLFVLVAMVWLVNRFQRRLEFLATTDELTGLSNRRYFMERCKQRTALSLRYQHIDSLMVLDADHFKKINDTHGHHAGDEMLKLIAQALCESLREVDIIGRWGGEEFVALLHQSNQEDARHTAERVRKAIKEKVVAVNEKKVHCTVSIGIVTSTPENADLDDLLRRADAAMYRAKSNGRDQVCMDETV